MLRHLFHTRAEVLRLTAAMDRGIPRLTWLKVATVVDPLLGTTGELLCRLDLNFMRPGRDQPMPIVAGRAPDRIGLMFFDAGNDVRAGDRIRTITGPVAGTFELKASPDPAVAYSYGHHMEVQIVEVAQPQSDAFPGASIEQEVT